MGVVRILLLGSLQLVFAEQLLVLTLWITSSEYNVRYRYEYITVRDIKVRVEPTKLTYCQSKASTSVLLKDITEQVQNDLQWKWITDKIKYNWEHWVNAVSDLRETHNVSNNRTKKRILVVPGVLKATPYTSNSSISSGGPLGDLYQWSDVISSLHILGHNVTLVKDFYQVARSLRYNKYNVSYKPGCPQTDIDLVFADYITMKTFPLDVLNKYRCKFRVLDAYGTEVTYNDIYYSLQHNYISLYGQLGLNLKQFYTFYPHTPDNSFMGFTVISKPNTDISKENIGILYGKDIRYFKGKDLWLHSLLYYMDVHSTLHNSTTLPKGIYNHGILTTQQYHNLLSRAKYFIGVGLPLESTGVMEALSYGCIILNPRFKGEMQHTLQTGGKPTTRMLTSQIPYLEDYIGPPHVYTLDIDNITEIHSVLKGLQTVNISRLSPYPFTIQGLITRLNRYLENQDFCDVSKTWSPTQQWIGVLSLAGQSCTYTCQSQGLVCEPAFFNKLNIREHIDCPSVIDNSSIYHPSYHTDSNTCLRQTTRHLYSCGGGHMTLQRLCPCRTIVPDMA